MKTLYQLRMEKGLSQNDVATRLNMSRVNYTNIENGKRGLTQENACALADLFGVSVDALFGRSTEAAAPIGRTVELVPQLQPSETAFVPLVASLRCGFGTAGDPFQIIARYPVPREYLTRYGSDIKAVTAVGSSMLPTITPGSVLICSPGDAWEDGQIVICNADDADTVKRIFRAPDGGVDLRPDNPDFQPQHYTPADLAAGRCSVLGRVRRSISPEL